MYTAGCRAIELFDETMAMKFPALVLHPSSSPEQPEKFGPYTLSVSMNGSIEPGSFPLVVVSHGTGGSHLLYRTLAAHLARNGFVVALPEHPLNNRNNNDLAGTAANLMNRPRHIRIVIDWAFSSAGFQSCLTPNAVVLIGHSLGGYTALAVAGGRPTAFPKETPEQQSRLIEVTPDDRVKALVLLAPASVWFMTPGALSGVRIPIFMLTAEKDPHTPPLHAEIVKGGIPDKVLLEHRIVANAGHFSFLSPFPEGMVSPVFPPTQDPEGFDRESFHEEMNAEILRFLNRVVQNS